MKNKGRRYIGGLAAVMALAMVLSVFGAVPVETQNSPHTGTSPEITSAISVDSSVGTKESVIFTENGLPSSTNWSVQFGSLFASSNSSSITFKVSDGSYSYFVYYSGYSGYVFHGNTIVSGSSVSVSLAFHALTFSNTGATSGFAWEISVKNETGYSDSYFGNNDSVTFYVANGNYSYSVMSGNSTMYSMYEVASGYRVVSGSSMTVDLKFYKLSVSETGLPVSQTGYSWSARISNKTGFNVEIGIPGSLLSLFVLGGNYTYSVQYINVQIQELGATSFPVKTGYINTSISTKVSLAFEKVTFSEKGMPAGGRWAVAAFNESTSASDAFVTGQSAGSLYLLSGNYEYVSYIVSGHQPTYSNDTPLPINVNHSPVSAPTVVFKGVYNVTFTETGLPAGTDWSIQNIYLPTTGYTSFSTSRSTLSLYIANGSYSYFLSNPTFDRSQTKSFTVSGRSQSVSATFYKLAFRESGLPYQSSWSVNIYNGTVSGFYMQQNAPGEIVFYVTNLTFTYSFAAYPFNSPYSSSAFQNGTTPGRISITTSGATVNVPFTTARNYYTLTFVESGLISGTQWYATLDYPNYGGFYYSSSNGNNITYVVQNGSYSYNIDGVSSGTVFVKGHDVVVNINLSWTKYATIGFREYGLPASALWSVEVSNISHSSNTSEIYFTEPHGEYLFSISAPSGYIAYPSSGEISLSGNTLFSVQFQPRTNESVGYVSKTISLISGRVSPGDYYMNQQYESSQAMMAYDSSNGMIYMANSYIVLVINSSSSVIPLYMQTGFNGPYGVAYDSSNGHVYVANSGSNTIAVVNTSTNRVTQQIPMGQNSQPLLLLYNAYNKYLYAYDSGTGNVSVVNATSNEIVKNITVGNIVSDPIHADSSLMTFSTENGNVFILNQNSGNITEINGSDNRVIMNVTLQYAGLPTAIAFIPSTDSLYVAGFQNHNITVLNASNLSFERNITLPGAFVTSMVYDSSNGYAYVGDLNSEIFIVNAKNNSYVTSIPVDYGPFSMVLVTGGNTVFDYNDLSGSISEISQLEPAKTLTNISTLTIYATAAIAVVIAAGAGSYVYLRKKH